MALILSPADPPDPQALVKITHNLAEGQVLQRRGRKGAALARIQGECGATGAVFATISAAGAPLKTWAARKVGVARAGCFSAVLKGIPVGGPYRLELRCGAETTRVKTFYCGDVWLLAGQSNMQGVGNMEGAAKPHPLVRVFSLRREWRQARDPLHVETESPDACHHGGRPSTPAQAERLRSTVNKGVGAGLFFAREMLARSGVPQGLITAAHGGTTMAQWSPALAERGGESLYASMFTSLRATGQPVAGMLWYQGESDTDDEAAAAYTGRMIDFVAAVRRDLRQPTLPWIMVQIGPVCGGWGGPRWNDIQEQQRLLPERIRNLDTISAIDLELDDNIHIAAVSFPTLGARLARAASRLVHGVRGEEPMPRLREIVPPNPKDAPHHIDVVFAHVGGGGLRSTGPARGFVVLDAEGAPVPCIHKTTLHGDTARLHFHGGTTLPAGAQLCHGHGRAPVCTITDGRGCALPVFGPQPIEGRKTSGRRTILRA